MVHRHKWDNSLEVIDIDKVFKLERPPWSRESIKPKARVCRTCGEVQVLRTVMRLGMMIHFYVNTTRLPMDVEVLEKKRRLYTRLSFVPLLLMVGFILLGFMNEQGLIIDLSIFMIMFVLFVVGVFFVFNRLFKYEFEEEAYLVKNPWSS